MHPSSGRPIPCEMCAEQCDLYESPSQQRVDRAGTMHHNCRWVPLQNYVFCVVLSAGASAGPSVRRRTGALTASS